MPRNRLPRVMKHYCPTGRRKRLLDKWDRNGSTSDPSPWKIYDDDDDDDDKAVMWKSWNSSLLQTINMYQQNTRKGQRKLHAQVICH
jgi:hypothetical protein